MIKDYPITEWEKELFSIPDDKRTWLITIDDLNLYVCYTKSENKQYCYEIDFDEYYNILDTFRYFYDKEKAWIYLDKVIPEEIMNKFKNKILKMLLVLI